MNRVDTTIQLLHNPFALGELVIIPRLTILRRDNGLRFENRELSIEVTSSEQGELVFFDQASQGKIGYMDEDGETTFVTLTQKVLEANNKPVKVVGRKSKDIVYV